MDEKFYMREKLTELMRAENLKPGQLADLLATNPAIISHLLAGRNKPGFDFVQKLLRAFPRLNPDWLLLDSGPLYRDDAPDGSAAPPLSAAAASVSGADFAGGLFGGASPSGGATAQSGAALSGRPAGGADAAGRSAAPFSDGQAEAARAGRRVTRVIVLYNDHTFESYRSSDD